MSPLSPEGGGIVALIPIILSRLTVHWQNEYTSLVRLFFSCVRVEDGLLHHRH